MLLKVATSITSLPFRPLLWWIQLPACGFPIKFSCSSHSPRIHCCWARSVGRTDRQTDGPQHCLMHPTIGGGKHKNYNYSETAAYNTLTSIVKMLWGRHWPVKSWFSMMILLLHWSATRTRPAARSTATLLGYCSWTASTWTQVLKRIDFCHLNKTF